MNLREAFGLIIAFVYGWNMLVVNYSGSLAAVATVFVQYAAAALGIALANGGRTRSARSCSSPASTGSASAPARMDAEHPDRAEARGDRRADRDRSRSRAARRRRDAAAAPLNPLAFGGVLLPVLFAYGGWAYINNIAGEIREPQRNLPRALFFGMLLVATCYLLANLAYLLVLGHAGSPRARRRRPT